MNRLHRPPETMSLLQPPEAHPEAVVGAARLKIGDLAKLTGRSVRALRLYEELGLLHPEERTHGGFRVYNEKAVARVQWIGKLQDLGFTLNAIQDLCNLANPSENGAESMRRVKDCFEAKLFEVRQQAEKLRALEQELVSSLTYLQKCSACQRGSSNVVCSSCAEPGHDAASTPELVNGIRAGM